MANESGIVKKFKSSQDALVIQASDLSLETISQMAQTGAIDVAPLFQRRERWDQRRQSALIESFLMNVPVPPVYLSEDDYGSYSVIDGKQRITAIRDFMSDAFPLAQLVRFEEINGLKFSDLPSELQNALRVRPYIRAITILRQSDRSTKYEVFHRLNSGGEPLNAQEIRNVIYRGPLNDLLMELSEAPFLRRHLKIRDNRSSAYNLMQDAEVVLRFFVLLEQWQEFSGDYRVSMDTYMEANMNMNLREVSKLRDTFLRALDACERIWGEFAFKRPEGAGWRDQMLAGMYDAQMVAVSLVDDKRISSLAARSAEVIQETRDLFTDKAFNEAVRLSTNTPSRVAYRIGKVLQLVQSF
ncbi:hypothetical protein ADK38_10025 [Streptomyces varsoviensis]|uniref:GmrSD restriction endonucleases N-terminal domain-containing protein n=2 Tax=Streptomyces varsoviensis TaxID=67373 RepID=A0ABR5J9Z5_9ACTN|nr:hypothetical protein ADK38_10025 [Streptomyces varsoviensis]